MENNREKSLWGELNWVFVLMAILITLLLSVIFFIVGAAKPMEGSFWSLARTFTMDIIASLIPTFILFVGAYALFRRISALRSERDTEEVASRVTQKLLEALKEQVVKIQNESTGKPSSSSESQSNEQAELESRIRREFQITDKHFDCASEPQKIVVQFKNRGNNVIRVEKIQYSQSGLGLPSSALLTSYRVDAENHSIIIPVASDKSEVLPENDFIVEIKLAQKWDRATIDGWAGKWGFLEPEVAYNNKRVNLLYSI